MLKRFKGFMILLLGGLLILVGCNTSVQMGDRIIGIQSGEFFYTNGILKTEYSGATFEQVWRAAEKTLEDLRARGIVKEKKIATASIRAVVQDENIRIDIKYLAHDITTVGIRVGTAGNTLASQFIHDKIKANLMNMNM